MNRSLFPRLFPIPATAALGLALFAGAVHCGDWPNWLGPKGDNTAPADGYGTDLGKWKSGWQTSVGRGYSAVTVAGGRAYALGHDEKSQETLFCFDAATGEVKWKHEYPAQLMPRMHPGGPNATPTVVGDKVLTVSKDGQVFCLSTAKGAVLWQANLATILGEPAPQWGYASSPLIDGGSVLLSSGKVTALDLATGHVLWTSQAAYHPGYSTPVVFKQGGKKFIAALDGKGFCVLSEKDGAEIARRPFKAGFDLTASTPTVLANGTRIFISGNMSCEMLGFDGTQLTAVWTNTELKNAMNNSVVYENTLYGIDGRQGSPCRAVALNLEDGKLLWSQAGFGYGTTIGVGPQVLALTESGEIVSFKASRNGYQEIGRRQLLGKTCWTTPVVANGRIYARNDRGDLVCLQSQ